MKRNLIVAALLFLSPVVYGQTTSATIKQANLSTSNPTNAEVFTPVPNVVVPAKTPGNPPSDAIILFDGKNLDEWVNASDKSPAKWTVAKDVLTVNKATGDIETKRKFGSYQLHIEWKIPADITGTGQARGNSGIFLSGKYEIQVLDTYNNDNKTYTNGMAGSVYREAIPLANPAKKAGEWNVYDIAYTDPEFNEDGTVKNPARVTIFFNGVLIQNNVAIQGGTSTGTKHVYTPHGPAPLRLQAHGDKSAPISYRNIWIRE
ncbi:DUF1080 domain-containing protein [Mucilaginibacter sp. UR6-11]|uniref:3-keto-disaccharide hydrolase n=1 Tax=Mucilaginibacter sp. UR6-11 TaxID=1435644 RepID=UPI001E5B0547|nr:DUF1080 domain-containing protein [Mucilaginibacter sp. UR6-11]MCC8426149.1 DUF1080 domain-containing protein [Mucilaginibacter sp. UR6-11]